MVSIIQIKDTNLGNGLLYNEIDRGGGEGQDFRYPRYIDSAEVLTVAKSVECSENPDQ